MPDTHPPIALLDTHLFIDTNGDPKGIATEVVAHNPSHLIVVPLIDHAGSGRQDGWRIAVTLSDGRRGYLTFSRRKLWRQEGEIDLGVCDRVFASLVIEEKR